MKYMLLVYADENKWDETQWEQCLADSIQLCYDLNAEGKYLDAAPLHPVAMATSVRVRESQRMVTDGPFAETTEQLGGYFLIEAKDLDEAIKIASRVPGARFGTIEIRPVFEIQGLPQSDAARIRVV